MTLPADQSAAGLPRALQRDATVDAVTVRLTATCVALKTRMSSGNSGCVA